MQLRTFQNKAGVEFDGEKSHIVFAEDMNALKTRLDSICHLIVAGAGVNGYLSPEGDVFVIHGGSVTFTPYPDSGYEVDEVRLDDEPVSLIGGSYTLENVQSDHVLNVSFKEASSHTYIYTASGFDISSVNGNYWDTGEVSDGYPVYVNENGVYLFMNGGGYGIIDVEWPQNNPIYYYSMPPASFVNQFYRASDNQPAGVVSSY